MGERDRWKVGEKEEGLMEEWGRGMLEGGEGGREGRRDGGEG